MQIHQCRKGLCNDLTHNFGGDSPTLVAAGDAVSDFADAVVKLEAHIDPVENGSRISIAQERFKVSNPAENIAMRLLPTLLELHRLNSLRTVSGLMIPWANKAGPTLSNTPACLYPTNSPATKRT